MSINVYARGDVARLSAIFTDDDGQPVNPDDITVTVRDSSGAVTTYLTGDVSSDSPATGIFYLDVLADKVGRWFYRWETTNQAAQEGEFAVTTTRFPG